MQKTYLESSARQTQKFGERFAKSLLKSGPKSQAVVLGLTGDLGGGKTTFLQGLAKGLGQQGRVLSPTFIIMRRMGRFYHLDCYRLKKPQELAELGFKKIIADPKNIVAVEWADRVKKVMPKDTIWLDFYFVDKNKRKIVVRSKHGR
jgi:tRNA threonylcarbamoyladenosine biosynthesis protein TsaE